jgi:hypothetical protein
MQFLKNSAAFCFTEKILTRKVRKQHNEIKGKITFTLLFVDIFDRNFVRGAEIIEILEADG